MARLLRPVVPVDVKCRVVLRQLGVQVQAVDEIIRDHRFVPRDHRRRSHGKLLAAKLAELAARLGCSVPDLRLDHDPALGARRKVFNGAGEHVEYDPPANSPDHLLFRPHGAEYAGSHDIKTRVRGEHGQHSDIVLVKRNRRLERREAGVVKPKARIPNAGGLTSCVRGGRCHCKRFSDYRSRRSRCGNWRKQKIGGKRCGVK